MTIDLNKNELIILIKALDCRWEKVGLSNEGVKLRYKLVAMKFENKIYEADYEKEETPQ